MAPAHEYATGDVLASLTTMVWNAPPRSWTGSATMADSSLNRRMTVRLGDAVALAQIGIFGLDRQLELEALCLYGLPEAVPPLLCGTPILPAGQREFFGDDQIGVDSSVLCAQARVRVSEFWKSHRRVSCAASARGRDVELWNGPFRQGCDPKRRGEPRACCLRPSVPIDRPDPPFTARSRFWPPARRQPGQPRHPHELVVTWKLMPESRVTVRNLSTTASAANAQVSVGFSPFGIGMPVTALSSISVSLAPLASADLLFPLTQAMLAGDQLVSVFVKIVHAADADQANNTGEQAITVA
jgi:hypothetical protein